MKFLKIIIVLLLIFFYLFFSYIRFYHFIGDIDLKSPYVERILKIENPKVKGSVKYVALGDSLTAGVGSSDITQTFPYEYASNLSKKYGEVDFLNLGQPGGTTVDVIENQVAPAIAENPDYITLLIGVNDLHNKRSISDFKEKYQSILDDLLTNTTAQITIINLPYIGSDKIAYPPFNFLLDFRTKQFNKAILEIVNNSANDRLKLVDLYNNTIIIAKQNQRYYSVDEFHPSNEGYVLWGQIIDAN